MRTLLLAVLLIFAATLAGAQTPDTPENRTRIAEQYVKDVGLEMTLSDMAKAVAKSFPPQDQPSIVAMFTKYMDLDRLRTVMVASMARYFTVEELQAMRDFYGSPVGKAITSKFPAYLGDAMPGIQSISMDATTRMIQDLKNQKR